MDPPMAKISFLKRQNGFEIPDNNPWMDSGVLLMNILTFLPITSLLPFKSVCKRWYEIISSSAFMNLHLNHHKFMNKPLIQQPLVGDNNNFLYKLLSVLSKTIYGPRPQTPCCAVVGYANGFACFWCNYMVQAYCLFDLKKKDFLFLPEFTSRPGGGDDAFVIQTGFDFIPAINDYKLVVITIGKDRAVYVNLYTKSTNSWKEISACLPCFMMQLSVCTFNGRQIMGTGVDEDGAECVVYFDMVAEKFFRIEWVNKEPYYLRRLTVSDERLVMFACPNVWNKGFDGWVLKSAADGGRPFWRKEMSIGPMISPFEPLGFWSNGMIVLGSVEDEGEGATALELWLYDPRSESTRMLHIGIGSHVRLPCLCQMSIENGM